MTFLADGFKARATSIVVTINAYYVSAPITDVDYHSEYVGSVDNFTKEAPVFPWIQYAPTIPVIFSVVVVLMRDFSEGRERRPIA